MKKIIKISSIILLTTILLIIYLSFIGIKTDKFNKNIKNNIQKINKKINLDLKNVKFLLDPFNFSTNVSTQDSIILLEGKKLEIKEIKTTISLKSLILDQFSIDDLKISTKKIKLNNIIMLAQSFKNSTELFLLNNFIKEGFLTADIKLKFDTEGKLKENYQVDGYINSGKFNFLNKLSAKNLSLNFNISKNKYSLSEVYTEINDVKFSSPLIEIREKKNLYLIKGKISTSKKNFNKDQLDLIFSNFLKNNNIEKTSFSSENNISFNVSKKLKFNNLNIASKINVDQLVVKNNFINLKPYLPNLDKIINLENHKVIINYNKNKLIINGNGEVLIKDSLDTINYEVMKNNNKFIFETKVNFKNNKLLISSLNYEKKENLDSTILIKGNLKKNSPINFDLISLIEKNNEILFKNLSLSKDFKFISIDSFNFNYLNNKKIKNQLSLKKDNLNYIIVGESFDATQLINRVINSDSENLSLFENLNSKISLKINKTYIDDINFINYLSGTINFKNNKINDLKLNSFFPNDKIINLSIVTNDKKEKITKLFTDYPKPLIKRYDFIKGFEEGLLVYYSVKKDKISNGLLTIEKFKVKKVPAFAKLLTLASLQGIADLLTGEGIRFTDFEMKFSNKKDLTTIEEMYAIGPAVSILMEGYIESKKIVSLRGTLVPATTINKSIASIPLLGNILIGKKTGEGVFGVSFKIKGKPEDLKTTVNPVKTLTPRFITRTLEKIKKN